MQYGVPTVVFLPDGKDINDLIALEKENISMVSKNINGAIQGLIELMSNHELSKEYSKNALAKMSINGVQNFSKELYNLMGLK